VWSLSKIATAPATGSYTATWNVYINGDLALQSTSLYPVDTVYTQNFIGKGDGSRNPFAGHLDSFYIFTVALTRGQARAVFANVRCDCSGVHTCVCGCFLCKVRRFYVVFSCVFVVYGVSFLCFCFYVMLASERAGPRTVRTYVCL
jgi:hypothetical protein